MKTTVKTFAMAALMMVTTATAFAHNNPGMRHDNYRKPTTVVVVNHNHRDMNVHNHRHLNKPMHNCMCKHCKKMRHDMEVARKRHEAEMRRMAAARHHKSHPEVNARLGRMAYNGNGRK